MYLMSTKKADKGSLSIKESVIVVKQREMETDLDFYLHNATDLGDLIIVSYICDKMFIRLSYDISQIKMQSKIIHQILFTIN